VGQFRRQVSPCPAPQRSKRRQPPTVLGDALLRPAARVACRRLRRGAFFSFISLSWPHATLTLATRRRVSPTLFEFSRDRIAVQFSILATDLADPGLAVTRFLRAPSMIVVLSSSIMILLGSRSLRQIVTLSSFQTRVLSKMALPPVRESRCLPSRFAAIHRKPGAFTGSDGERATQRGFDDEVSRRGFAVDVFGQ